MAPKGAMRMRCDEAQGVYLPEILDEHAITGDGSEYRCCPGKGVDYGRLSRALYGDSTNQAQHSFELGYFRKLVAAHANDSKYLKHATSGGVMTVIAAYLLREGFVDGVVATKFVYGMTGPRTATYIATTPEELIDAQGSKYCPTACNAIIPDCLSRGGRYMFVGTPCQVAALRMAAEEREDIAAAFPITMSNFCGGYRDFRDLDHHVKRHGIDPASVTRFRFRGGGQPGSMLIKTADGKEVSDPYPEYGRSSAYPKRPRCVYCIDATGELADISCGDAWIPRYQKDSASWSLIVLRSKRAHEILNNVAKDYDLSLGDVSADEVIESQRLNIESKKYRQQKRRIVCALAGWRLPRYDFRLPLGSGSFLGEIRVIAGKYLQELRTAKSRI